MKTDHKELRGFSLVELLVVIGILALLAAILVPVFVRSKAKAKETASLSMIRQNGLATLFYASDFDDRLPYALGANCFSLGDKYGKYCGALSPGRIQQMVPAIAVLNRYGVSPDVVRSPIDRMHEELLEEGGHADTWWKETATQQFYGSSFEYTGFDQMSGELRQTLAQAMPLYYSLFRFSGKGGRAHQTVYMDGHARALSDDELGRELLGE